MRKSLMLGIFLSCFLPVKAQQGFVIDHRNTNLTEIPDTWIDAAKANLKIRYFRRSHGSQVDVGGMDALRRYSTTYADKYNYNGTGANGALEMSTYWYSLDFENAQWVQITRDYLDDPANAHINTMMWAWSSYFFDMDVEQYLSDMETLIADYGPGGTKILSGERSVPVTFIFQTACSQMSTDRNQLVYEKNQLIREHCRTHNRILFDFNDFECYNPDGEYFGDGNPDGTYTDIHRLNDDISYNRIDGSRGNWGIEWNTANSATELAQLSADDICTVCEHSMGAVEGEIKDNSRLHCVLKGRGVWFLWARLAGWEENSLTIVPDAAMDESNLQGRTLNISLSNCRFSTADLQTTNFQLNNAPAGLAIQSVTYVDETHAELTLAFDGTNMVQDVNDFSVTIFGGAIECAQYICSNALEIKALDIINVNWTGNVSSDWNEPGNWSTGTLPDANCDVTIPAGLSVYPETNTGGSFSFNNLTLQSGGKFDFPAGNSLTVINDLTLNSSSSSYAQIIDNNNIMVNGRILYQKFLSGSSYHYVSSPLADVSSNTFTASAVGYNSNFYMYDETNNSSDWQQGWNHNFALGALLAGRGYAYFYKFDQTLEISGKQLNAGDVSIDISNSDNRVTSDGWNLVGNPYLSAISADEFVFENQDIISGTLYFWNDDLSEGTDYSTNDYALWNLAGAIGTGTGFNSMQGSKVPDGFIAPMQGFFVNKINPGTSQLWFRNTMRSFGNGQYFKSVEVPVRFKICLLNESLKLYNELLIAFVEGASNRFDHFYDGLKLQGNPQISFYSLLNNSELGIQSLPKRTHGNRQLASVALGLYVENAGDYLIDMASIEGFPEATSIYLEDKYLKEFHSLSSDGPYKFYQRQGRCNDRFLVHINPSARMMSKIDATAAKFNAYFSENKLIIEIDDSLIGADLIVYGVTGVPLVYEKMDNNRKTLPIQNTGNLLMLELKTSKLSLSKKLIIN